MAKTNGNGTRNGARRTVELVRQVKISQPAHDLLDDKSLPAQFVRVLIEKELLPDALQLIAHYLPKRQAVWWACQCVKTLIDAKTTAEEKAALEITEKWVAQPNEENRRAAMEAAQAAEPGSPAALVALAAGFSEQPPAPNPRDQEKQQYMTAKLAGGAVMLTAGADREKVKENLASFATQGLAVVNRTYPKEA